MYLFAQVMALLNYRTVIWIARKYEVYKNKFQVFIKLQKKKEDCFEDSAEIDWDAKNWFLN